jgi:hypothetical protein
MSHIEFESTNLKYYLRCEGRCSALGCLNINAFKLLRYMMYIKYYPFLSIMMYIMYIKYLYLTLTFLRPLLRPEVRQSATIAAFNLLRGLPYVLVECPHACVQWGLQRCRLFIDDRPLHSHSPADLPLYQTISIHCLRTWTSGSLGRGSSWLL